MYTAHSVFKSMSHFFGSLLPIWDEWTVPVFCRVKGPDGLWVLKELRKVGDAPKIAAGEAGLLQRSIWCHLDGRGWSVNWSEAINVGVSHCGAELSMTLQKAYTEKLLVVTSNYWYALISPMS
jgi:hypothetical protein